MAEGTVRAPSGKAGARRSSRIDESDPPATESRAESAAFLEAAARHLGEAGYAVELEIDDETGETFLYVEGLEIRFVKAAPEKRRRPVKH